MEERRSSYYQSLYEIALAVNSAKSPEHVWLAIAEKVTQAMGVKGCSLMLLTPDKKLLLHTAAYGLSDAYVRKGPVSADRSIAEALRGQAVSVLNAPEDDRIQYRSQAKQEGIASMLSAPMMLRDDIIGVIRLYTGEPRRFDSDDIFFVQAVANFGAIALESARLYDQVQKDYDELRRELAEWRAALGYEWVAGETVLPAEGPVPVIQGG